MISTEETVSANAETPINTESLDAPLESNTVSVMLMKAKVVIVIGASTGREYVFNGAGSVINDVDRTDAEDMINKHPTPSCCGSYPTPYFQIL